MSVFKASKELNVEGNIQVITREPGLYQVAIEKLSPGTKRSGTGDAAVDVPTIDVTLVVKKVVKLHRPEAHNAAELVGKKHTDQIKLDITDQKDFDKKVARIAHFLTKVGVAKETILAVEVASDDAKGWAKYQQDICKLFDPAVNNGIFNFKVIGGVMNSNTFTQAPGYLGFASELSVEQKFSSSEIQGNNAYYAALNGQTGPSADAGNAATGGGGGALAGSAF